MIVLAGPSNGVFGHFIEHLSPTLIGLPEFEQRIIRLVTCFIKNIWSVGYKQSIPYTVEEKVTPCRH